MTEVEFELRVSTHAIIAPTTYSIAVIKFPVLLIVVNNKRDDFQ